MLGAAIPGSIPKFGADESYHMTHRIQCAAIYGVPSQSPVLNFYGWDFNHPQRVNGTWAKHTSRGAPGHNSVQLAHISPIFIWFIDVYFTQFQITILHGAYKPTTITAGVPTS